MFFCVRQQIAKCLPLAAKWLSATIRQIALTVVEKYCHVVALSDGKEPTDQLNTAEDGMGIHHLMMEIGLSQKHDFQGKVTKVCTILPFLPMNEWQSTVTVSDPSQSEN